MDINKFTQELLYVVATGILPLLTLYVITYLKVKIKDLTTDIEDVQLRNYVNDAVDVMAQVVEEVNQTFVDSLKNSGKFTQEAAIEAKNLAIEKCKQLISENSEQAITILYNDYEAYLNSKIEELVRQNKL